MPEPIDLRTTLGWTLTDHARRASLARGVALREILQVIAAPEITYTAYDYGPGRMVYKRGRLAVVGTPASRRVITVLWNTTEQWTSEQFRNDRRPGRCLIA